MIVCCGGLTTSSFSPTRGGFRYDPVIDTWTATSKEGAPPFGGEGWFFDHTAIWTGSEMIIWGGWEQYSGGSTGTFNAGAHYNPHDRYLETHGRYRMSPTTGSFILRPGPGVR